MHSCKLIASPGDIDPDRISSQTVNELWRLAGNFYGTTHLRQPMLLRRPADVDRYPSMKDLVAGISIPTKETFINLPRFFKSFGPFTSQDWQALLAWSAQVQDPLLKPLLEERIARVHAGELTRQQALEQVFLLMIMGHEVGHHKVLPYDFKTELLINEAIFQVVRDQKKAAFFSNLYEDMVVNHRLFSRRELPLHWLYQKISPTKKPTDQLWKIYMRTYEILWDQPQLSDRFSAVGDVMEQDAQELARMVRNSQPRNHILYGAKVAAILMKYQQQELPDDSSGLDTHQPPANPAKGKGTTPHPAESNASGEAASSQDLREPQGEEIAQMTKEQKERLEAAREQARGMSVRQQAEKQPGQERPLGEYQELMQRMALAQSQQEATSLYYLDRAREYAVEFPTVPKLNGTEIATGVSLWDPGLDRLEELDMALSLQQGVVIPGVTTLKREYESGDDTPELRQPPDVMLYVDASVSMPDPAKTASPLVLAATIVAMSAINVGKQVRACSYEASENYAAMEELSDNMDEVMRYLTHYAPRLNQTQFPFQDMQDRVARTPNEPVHWVLISDKDLLSNLQATVEGSKGITVFADILRSREGGGTLFLNARMDEVQNTFKDYDQELIPLGGDQQKLWLPELKVSIYTVQSWDGLQAAAQDMSMQTYDPHGYAAFLSGQQENVLQP